MSHTSTIGTSQAPLDLSELSRVLMDRERPPVGFFISTALHAAICARFEQENANAVLTFPTKMHGVKLAVDPTLPDTEFEVALSDKAWSEKLRSLKP